MRPDAEPGDEKWVLAEDGTVTVPSSNIVSGMVFDKKYVPLPREVRNNFKLIGEASFKILGFTKQANIPEVR